MEDCIVVFAERDAASSRIAAYVPFWRVELVRGNSLPKRLLHEFLVLHVLHTGHE